jgi:hypothetical protein
MNALKSKEQVNTELKNAGINICLQRTVGHNSFHLVYETYGHFVVNAVAGTDYRRTREFTQKFHNITILIDN